jgi:uncharacterized sporulation protein YeaH/YhbH (DUF444 family)
VAKCFFFWMVRFLRLKYQQVELVFIAHDTEAEIVTEQDFFGRGEGGGTRCSSAYHVAREHMAQHYPSARWNVYLFAFSDGDNEPGDNARCTELVTDLLQECAMVAYGEIPWSGTAEYPYSTLLKAFLTITHERFMTTRLRSKEDVYGALQRFLMHGG